MQSSLIYTSYFLRSNLYMYMIGTLYVYYLEILAFLHTIVIYENIILYWTKECEANMFSLSIETIFPVN